MTLKEMIHVTPEDILEKRFERATVGGYRADDVNVFMGEISSEMEALYKERTELQNKLIVLAERLEEYRSDEESMRSALLGAQKLGDTIIKESKEKADVLLSGAVQEAEAILAKAKTDAARISHDAQISLQYETRELQRTKREVANFKQKMLTLYQQHMDLIELIPTDPIEESHPLPEPITTNISKQQEKKKEVSSYQENKDPSSAVIEQKQEEVPKAEGTFSKPKETDENFKPLQFGAGFRLADDD